MVDGREKENEMGREPWALGPLEVFHGPLRNNMSNFPIETSLYPVALFRGEVFGLSRLCLKEACQLSPMRRNASSAASNARGRNGPSTC
jgi:hypothetical protein